MGKDTVSKIAALKQKKEQLAKRLTALEQKARMDGRKRETRQKIIVGGLVLAHMAKDESFARVVRRLLAEHVTRPHDREAVAELLGAPPTSETKSASFVMVDAPASAPQSPPVDFGKMAAGSIAKGS